MKFEKKQIHFLSDAFVADTVGVAPASLRDLKIRGRRRQRKHPPKSEFAFIQSSSRQFQLTYFVKFRRTPLGVEFVKSISKFRKRKKIS